MAFQLDDLAHKLIRLLRLNGRRPNSDLAAVVGLFRGRTPNVP